MRPEPNNDIDLLLRQLSRRNGIPVSENEEQHLDADELNSYVANALPAAARARYTAHLADCSSCRKLVVELSAAQGPVPVQSSATAPMPSGLKSFLASLFSPMVLRYAVPALGLIVVAVVGVFVMNQNRPKDSVAQLTDADQNKAVQAGRQAPEAPAAQGYLHDSNSANKPDARERESVAGETKEDQTAKVAAPVTRAAPAVVANQPADATGTAAAEAPPPPAPKPAAQAEDEAARAADFQKEKKAAATQPATPLARGGAGVVKDGIDGADKNEAKKTETTTVTAGAATRKDIVVRPAKSPETTDSAVADSKRAPTQEKLRERSRELRSEESESDAVAETRTVAGRRFKKSGRVWIDTAFNSSKPITTVARGSEQYRALVADEPSIRKIADELDGEIVVVWKGSTYRIR